MGSKEVAHDLAVSMATKQSDNPAEVIDRYFELLEQLKKLYSVRIDERNRSRHATVG